MLISGSQTLEGHPDVAVGSLDQHLVAAPRPFLSRRLEVGLVDLPLGVSEVVHVFIEFPLCRLAVDHHDGLVVAPLPGKGSTVSIGVDLHCNKGGAWYTCPR